LATIASKVFLSIDTISIYFFFDVIVPFAAKEYIMRYPTMDFSEMAACGTDTAEVVRGGNVYTSIKCAPFDCYVIIIIGKGGKLPLPYS
jgi:hypothetical protein